MYSPTINTRVINPYYFRRLYIYVSNFRCTNIVFADINTGNFSLTGSRKEKAVGD